MKPPKPNARARAWRRRLHSLISRGPQKSSKPKRIRITRLILLAGEPVEKGEVRAVEKLLALDLIAAGSAVPLRTVWWVVAAACLLLAVGVVLWLCRLRGWW